MNGVIINDEVYKLVKDGEDFDCEDCALHEYCHSLKGTICYTAFNFVESHFEKVNSVNDLEDDKQSETPNQTYFY